MKKTLLFLVLSILFIQCSPEDDVKREEQQEKPEDLEISVTIEGEFLNENREKFLYISNEEGKIEGQIALQNNQENILTIEREPDTKYHLIVHDKLISKGRTRHDFSIFENMQSSGYTIKGYSVVDRPDLAKVDLHIVNTGNMQRLGSTGGGSSSQSSENGGTFTSTGYILSNPGDYYYSFLRQDEPFARYFWTENIKEDASFTLDYEELPTATLVETQLPEHQSAAVFLHGYRSEHPGVGHSIKMGNTQGMQVFESYRPEEAIFDYFTFNLGLFDGTTSYSFYAVSEVIPASIEIPSFDFTINNFSVDDTQYTTTGEYNISSASFVISEDNVNIQSLVKVYSEPGSEISFSISPLINSLFEKVPSLDSAQLEPLNISLFSYNFREKYQGAVKGFIEGNNPRTPGDFTAVVSRKDN